MAANAKDIRPDTVRNTTRGHQVVFLFMMLSERLPVIGGKHPLDVRFLVENLAAQLVVGYHSGVAVVLQGAAAHSSVSPNWATSAWFLVIISLIATLDLVVQS